MFANLISLVFKDRNGYVGRKLVAAWAVTFLVTFVLTLHVIINLMLVPTQHIQPLIDSNSYHLILIAVWGTFFTSDSINAWAYSTRANNDQPRKENELLGDPGPRSRRADQSTPGNAS